MHDGHFELGETRSGPRVVLTVRGELDMATSGELRSAIERAFGECSELLVDLSHVGFMDSTGLSALVSGHRAGNLVVICPDGPARRTIEVCGLQDVLRLYRERREVDRLSS